MPVSPARARFQNACAQIGAGLGDFGYRYLRSKRQAERVTGEWTQVVSFRSSERNTAGDIRLWAWYWIDSEEVRRWRRERGAAGDSGRVFGCALGYLGARQRVHPAGMSPGSSSAQPVRAAPSSRACPAGQSQPATRAARAWENLTAEYGVRLVGVPPPVSDICQPVRRAAADADEGIQGAGVTQDHPAPIDWQVAEQDHVTGRAGGPRDAEIDVEDGDCGLAVKWRRGRGGTHEQRS